MRELSLSGHTHTASQINGLSKLNVVYKNNGITYDSAYINISTKFKATWFILCDVAYSTNFTSAIVMGYNNAIVAFSSSGGSGNRSVLANMVPTDNIDWGNKSISFYNSEVYSSRILGAVNAFAIYG